MADVNPLPWYQQAKFGYFVVAVAVALIGYFTGVKVNPVVVELRMVPAASTAACSCK